MPERWKFVEFEPTQPDSQIWHTLVDIRLSYVRRVSTKNDLPTILIYEENISIQFFLKERRASASEKMRSRSFSLFLCDQQSQLYVIFFSIALLCFSTIK